MSGTSIECRVLQGFHRIPYAGFTSAHTNRRCENDPRMMMIGASIDGRPVGLAVMLRDEDDESALLESIFVDPPYRGRGVGRRLLEAVEAKCFEESVKTLSGSWYDDAPSAASVAGLIGRSGWSDPETVTSVHRGGRPLLEHADRTSRKWSCRPGFAIESWSELSAVDLEQIERLKKTHGISIGLHPEGESMLPVSASTSVVLRRGGEVVGWMVHHVLGSETLRYSSLWLHPDLIGRGLGIAIAIESSRRHLAVVDRLPRLIFFVLRNNDAMHRFIARRMKPAIDRSSTLLRSERTF